MKDYYFFYKTISHLITKLRLFLTTFSFLPSLTYNSLKILNFIRFQSIYILAVIVIMLIYLVFGIKDFTYDPQIFGAYVLLFIVYGYVNHFLFFQPISFQNFRDPIRLHPTANVHHPCTSLHNYFRRLVLHRYRSNDDCVRHRATHENGEIFWITFYQFFLNWEN